MALSRLAAEFAAEIKLHDWSDAPFRIDKAGHHRQDDKPGKRSDRELTWQHAMNVCTNAMWVTAQVLAHRDPNFDVGEFADACGVTGLSRAALKAGLRHAADNGYQQPGTRIGIARAQV